MSRTVWRTSLGMSTYVEVVISPATSTRPVVNNVSQATRLSGSSVNSASSTASEIWSAILSGWPSVTDSDVKVYRELTEGSILIGGLGPWQQAAVAGTVCRWSQGPERAAASSRAQQRAHSIQYGVSNGVLAPQGHLGRRSVGAEDGDLIGVVVESDALGGHVVGDHQIDPFADQLRPCPLEDPVGLSGEPDKYLPLPSAPSQFDEDVRRRLEDQLGHAVGLAQFGSVRHFGPEVCHRRGHDDHVGTLGPRQHRRLHVGRGLHRDLSLIHIS